MGFLRSRAWLLLLVAMAMVLDTSCSHSPPPNVRSEARALEDKNVVVRFHSRDGITYVTSSYAVTDSSIVIRNSLRDTKYYAPLEAELYNQLLTPAPGDIALPAEMSISSIRSVDQWQPRSAGRDVGGGLLIIAGIVVVVVLVVMHNVSFGED